MRVLLLLLLTLALQVSAQAGDAASGRVFKVLQFYVDQEGQIAKSPSLFDRDAYQAELRVQTNLVSGLRYDVLWSAKNTGDAPLKLRLELRGTGTNNLPRLKTLEADVKPGYFRKWTPLTLELDEFKSFSSLTAWRATLWEGDKMLGEQKSFLW